MGQPTFLELLERTVFALFGFIIIYSICWGWWDIPTATAVREGVRGSAVETLAHGIEVIFEPEHWAGLMVLAGFLGMVVWWPVKRLDIARHLFIFAGGIFLALAVAAVLKYSLARYRPIELFDNNNFGFSYFSGEHDQNSTPSGHTTAAFAGLAGLARPTKSCIVTILALCVAGLIAVSRVLANAHYIGDVVFGAFVGVLGTAWAGLIVESFYTWFVAWRERAAQKQ